jgi:hypothetical protein
MAAVQNGRLTRHWPKTPSPDGLENFRTKLTRKQEVNWNQAIEVIPIFFFFSRE